MHELIIFLIGIVMTFVGFKLVKKNRALLKNGIRTSATVVSTHSYSSDNSDPGVDGRKFRSTVKFTTKDKQTIEVELGDANRVQDPIGSSRKIIYDPELPQEAQTDDMMSMYIAPLLFFALGIGLFVWGLLEMLSVTNLLS